MDDRVRRLLWGLVVIGACSVSLGAQGQPDPTRYEATIKDWEIQDAVTVPPADAIVVTGSSSITRWDSAMSNDLAPLTVIPRGFGGSRMADLLYYVDRLVIAYKPRAVVIYEGDNDTGADRVKAETIIGQFEQVVATIHQALPETRIYVMSVKPSIARWDVWPEAQRTNSLFRSMAAKDERLFYIDVASHLLQPTGEVMTDIFVPDNLHLNEKGTNLWAAAIREVLIPAELQYEPDPSR